MQLLSKKKGDPDLIKAFLHMRFFYAEITPKPFKQIRTAAETGNGTITVLSHYATSTSHHYLVLSRQLGPADFGLIALAMVVIDFESSQRMAIFGLVSGWTMVSHSGCQSSMTTASAAIMRRVSNAAASWALPWFSDARFDGRFD